MALDDLIKLGKKEAKGQKIRERFVKEQGVNAMAEIASIEGRADDPAVAGFVDMAPARQRGYLEDSVAQYGSDLSEGVLADLPTALSGFKEREHVVGYLLNRKPIDISHELTEGHKKAYAGAHLLQNEEAVETETIKYVKKTVGKIGEDVEARKMSRGLGEALSFIYMQNKGLARNAVVSRANEDVDEFAEAVTLEKGRDYIGARINAMEDKDKAQEAYEVGRAIYAFAGK